MVAELDALRVIADQLIQSDPSKAETWDKDLSACIPIAKAHLFRWSVDQQNRADRRRRGKFNVWTSNKTLGIFASDSELETKAIRRLGVEMHGLNRSNNAISNACAEMFLSRTSAPYYHDEVNAYPFQAPSDGDVTSKTGDIWVFLRGSSGSVNHSISEDFKRIRHYYSPQVRVALLVRSGLLNEASASQVMKKVYPHGLYVPIFQRGNPSIQPGLGAQLHVLGDSVDKQHLAAIACRGVFSALLTWQRFSDVLVQGGWPWLRQYSSAYAKKLYTVMVLIFAAIENYELGDTKAMCRQIMALAGKLVGNPDGGTSPWQVRQSVYLRGPKAVLSGTVEGYQKNGQAPANHLESYGSSVVRASNGAEVTQTPAIKSSGHATDSLPWTLSSTAVTSPPQPLPSHITTGNACLHGSRAPLTGRVRVAHSLAELQQGTADADSITVALTRGDQNARREVLAYVADRSMMAVRRAEGQCIGCAVKLGHCVGALVVAE